jgi:hypothetical protein
MFVVHFLPAKKSLRRELFSRRPRAGKTSVHQTNPPLDRYRPLARLRPVACPGKGPMGPRPPPQSGDRTQFLKVSAIQIKNGRFSNRDTIQEPLGQKYN